MGSFDIIILYPNRDSFSEINFLEIKLLLIKLKQKQTITK